MIIRKALEYFKAGICTGGRRITNLRYADDIILLAGSPEEIQDLINRMNKASDKY